MNSELEPSNQLNSSSNGIPQKGKPGSSTTKRIDQSSQIVKNFDQVYSPGSRNFSYGIIAYGVFNWALNLGLFFINLPVYETVWVPAASWFLLALVVAAILYSTRLLNRHTNVILAAVFAIGLGTVIVLDFWALKTANTDNLIISSSYAVGVPVLMACTMLDFRKSIICSSSYAVFLVASLLITAKYSPEQLLTQKLAPMLLTVLPGFILTFVLRKFQQTLYQDLERIHARGNLNTPQFIVNPLIGPELAELDHRAEKLLEAVASEQLALPLDETQANEAKEIASSLRTILLINQQQTWLDHAIANSPKLNKVVQLSDPKNLAGLLNPNEREALFSAIWMISTGFTKSTSILECQFEELTFQTSPPVTGFQPQLSSSTRVQITLVVSGLKRWRVNPTIWSELSKLGEFSIPDRKSHFRVVIKLKPKIT